MAEKRIVVTYGDKSKLIALDTNEIANAVGKIRLKFNAVGDFKLKAKCEDIQQYVDIDIDDEDDVYVLQNASELVVSPILATSGCDSLDMSLDESLSVDSEASEDSSSSSFSPSAGHSAHSTPTAKKRNDGRGIDIDDLLQKNPKGPAILKEYEENNTLTPQSRRNLVHIVTAGLVNSCHTPYYPLAHEKASCAKAIVERFPSLKNKHSKTGYEHFFCDKGKQSGFIQDRLKNLRRYIPVSYKKRRAKASTTPAKQTKVNDVTEFEPLPEEEAAKLASFCKRAPPDLKKDIVKSMADIHGNLTNWIYERSPTAAVILQEYPRFLDTDELISQHFRMRYGSELSKQLLLKWESVIAPGIMKLAASTTTAEVQQLYEECHTDEELSSEVLAMYAFLMLVLFLPCQKRQRGSQKQAMKLLIDFRPIGTILEQYLSTTRIQKQPYLLGLGTRRVPSQFFIVVDSKPISCKSGILSAIDKLFKLHYVFNVHFATQLGMFYKFLESVVYGIIPINDDLPNKIIEMNNAIEATSTQSDA